ncbi:hypothetical protein DDZ13_15285, partial [Coraliomargarita sinensis]
LGKMKLLTYLFLFIVPLLVAPAFSIFSKKKPESPDESWVIRGATEVHSMLSLVADGREFEYTELQGGGVTWQGHRIYLRFRIEPELVEELFSSYEKKKWAKIKPDFIDIESDIEMIKERSTTFIDFVPKWNPLSINHKVCYKIEGKNNWTHEGYNCAVVDKDTGIVYFFAWGA